MSVLTELFFWLKKHWISLTILLFLVVITYFNSLHNELVSDDIYAIKDQEKLLTTTEYIFDTPRAFVRSFLFFLVYKMNGTNPLGYRLINIFFHIGVVFLVYAIVPYFSKKRNLPFMVAALMAVHPVMVESVTWISGGIYSQSAFFLLLSFLFYIKNHNEFRIKLSISSLVFFVLALSSSEKVIVFPLILFLYEFCFFSLKKEWKKTIPYFVTSFIWFFILIPDITPRMEFFQESRGEALQFYNPLSQIPNAIGGYIRLLLWPDLLSFYHYDLLLATHNMIINIILFIVFILGLFYFYKKNKLLFFWLAFFVISLGVTLNPFGLSWLVAERYGYIGMVGLFFIIGYFLTELIESKSYKETGYILFGIIIFSLMVRSIMRNNDWKKTESLWRSTAESSPSYVASQNNVANIYVLNGEYEKAVEAYKTAIKLNPQYSYSYYNLGYTLRILKRHQEAIPLLQTAIKLNPKYWQSYEQLGGIYYETGKFTESEVYIRRAIELAPNVSMLWAQLGTLELRKGNIAGAKSAFEKALSMDPKNAIAISELNKLK